jgi:hypothetical protein
VLVRRGWGVPVGDVVVCGQQAGWYVESAFGEGCVYAASVLDGDLRDSVYGVVHGCEHVAEADVIGGQLCGCSRDAGIAAGGRPSGVVVCQSA